MLTADYLLATFGEGYSFGETAEYESELFSGGATLVNEGEITDPEVNCSESEVEMGWPTSGEGMFWDTCTSYLGGLELPGNGSTVVDEEETPTDYEEGSGEELTPEIEVVIPGEEFETFEGPSSAGHYNKYTPSKPRHSYTSPAGIMTAKRDFVQHAFSGALSSGRLCKQ